MTQEHAHYPTRWERDALLADGTAVRIRPIRADDGDRLVRFHQRLSPETVYRRFFSVKPTLTDVDVRRFTHVDYVDRMAFVAVRGDDLIGIGRYDRIDAGDVAEVAFVIDDLHQGHGIGTLLLEYLAVAARENGITRFIADTLPDNRPMLALFRAAGFRETARMDQGVTRVVLDIEPTAIAIAASDEREWHAAVRSVERLLRPRSIAILGAGRNPDNLGHIIVRNLLDGGFRGPVYPINPNAQTIAGAPAYASVNAVQGHIDLAVVALPAAAVIDAVDACAVKGVGGLVIVSSGFAETGGAGAELQRQLVEHAHRGGMRLIGPNCIGVINTEGAVRMDATFAAGPTVAGRVAFASQSGALGIAMLERAAAMSLGLSSFVSMGNKADVSGNDLLRYWEQDEATDVILMYLESFGNPRTFSRVARRVSMRKPIVAVKAGRSAIGARAASSHTAAMATPDTAVDALFHQTGVIRVDSLGQLFDVAAVLSHQPLPLGPRVAVVGNAGGAGILAADALDAAGLDAVELDDDTRARVRLLFPTAASTANPVDLGAGATPRAFRDVLSAVLESPSVDAVIAVYAPVPSSSTDEIAAAVAGAATSRDRPVLATFLGLDHAPSPLAGERGTVPFFSFVEPAAHALAAANAYARWRERPAGKVPELPGVDPDAAHAIIGACLREHPQGTWMDASTAGALLSTYGISVAPTVHVDSAAAAARAAGQLGLPVALKVAAPSIVHKTDVSGVQLGLRTRDAVRRAYAAMADRLGAQMGGAVVQAMAPPGVEVIVGVVHDDLFGPLVMFGSGGVATEVFGDRTFRILPLTDADAHDMVRATRGAPLLFGHRAAPPVDVGALEGLLLRIARMADDIPQLAEMDLNPVIVSPHGAVVVDAKARLAPWTPRPELTVRHLRDPGVLPHA
jgi:acetyl coenzyme A synthetase (ADP forming)-like protein